jgi:hypothetical protein
MSRVKNRLLAFAMGSALLCAPAWGVLVIGPQGRNTTPPSDPGMAAAWDLEGLWNTAQGSFLGTPIAPNYFIAANHVAGNSSNTFNFQSQTYTIDPSFGTNGGYNLPGSDLTLWKVNQTFSTYAPMYNGASETGKHLITFGRGSARGAAVNDVATNTTLRGWRWTNTFDSLKSWGENDVTGTFTDPTYGPVFDFSFDQSGGNNEGALSIQDSSGGVFILDGGVWKLAGVNLAAESTLQGAFSTSPDGSNPFNASLFDKQGFYEDDGAGNFTLQTTHEGTLSYASRISSHYAEIAALVPEPGSLIAVAMLGSAALLRRRREDGR